MTDVNADAFQAMLRNQQAAGSTNPNFTGATGAVGAIAGVNLGDTRGLLSDTGGLMDPNKAIAGLGSMFTSRKGPGAVSKALADTQNQLHEMSVKMGEQLRAAAQGLVGAGVTGGSGAGGIDAPPPTPSSGKQESSGRSA